jgi:putative transposase
VGTVLLKRLYVLVFTEHGTRRMHLGGITANPTGEWTVQQTRDLAFNTTEPPDATTDPKAGSRILFRAG